MFTNQVVGGTDLVGALLRRFQHRLRQAARGLLVRVVLVHQSPIGLLHPASVAAGARPSAKRPAATAGQAAGRCCRKVRRARSAASRWARSIRPTPSASAIRAGRPFAAADAGLPRTKPIWISRRCAAARFTPAGLGVAVRGRAEENPPLPAESTDRLAAAGLRRISAMTARAGPIRLGRDRRFWRAHRI